VLYNTIIRSLLFPMSPSPETLTIPSGLRRGGETRTVPGEATAVTGAEESGMNVTL
jgi:hypothetical protein